MNYCEAHLEREAVKVEEYRMGLCRDCFEGKPIDRAIEQGGYMIRQELADKCKAAAHAVRFGGTTRSKRTHLTPRQIARQAVWA